MTFDNYWRELDNKRNFDWIMLAGFITAGVIAVVILPLTGGK